MTQTLSLSARFFLFRDALSERLEDCFPSVFPFIAHQNIPYVATIPAGCEGASVREIDGNEDREYGFCTALREHLGRQPNT